MHVCLVFAHVRGFESQQALNCVHQYFALLLQLILRYLQLTSGILRYQESKKPEGSFAVYGD